MKDPQTPQICSGLGIGGQLWFPAFPFLFDFGANRNIGSVSGQLSFLEAFFQQPRKKPDAREVGPLVSSFVFLGRSS